MLMASLNPRLPSTPRLLALAGASFLAGVILLLGMCQQQPKSNQVSQNGPVSATTPSILLLSDKDASALRLPSYKTQVLAAINDAKHSIRAANYIIRPARDSVDAILAALAKAQKRGVKVEILIDDSRKYQSSAREDKNDEGIARAAALGLNISMDTKNRILHTKCLIIDGATAIVGSHNWTHSALGDNHETSILTHDPQIIADLERFLDGVEFGTGR
jgi:phosphatidylserine/phosphatidylglycerophosphate/cardiolipin synthase-like enzyme